MLFKILLVWFILSIATAIAWPSIARRLHDMNPDQELDK